MTCRIQSSSAEAGGFEPPVQLPVRQFSKLVVSATHPNFLFYNQHSFQMRCKCRANFWTVQIFPTYFFHRFHTI